MNKRIKVTMIVLLFFIIITITNICYGKSYSIDDMNIEATILEDGSVSVKQEINVYSIEDNNDLKSWGHGNYNGFSQIISNNHANFKTKNVRSGEFVAARLMFDLDSIPFCTKTSGILVI